MILKNNKLFECALGCHKYTIPLEENKAILICRNCRKFGYWENSFEIESQLEFNNKGNLIHRKFIDGHEIWGKYISSLLVYWRDSKGNSQWLNNKGKWVDKKPKNWRYEKYFE